MSDLARSTCRTPGARWRTQINPDAVSVRIGALDGRRIGITTEAEAVQLERELHDVIQRVLAPRWGCDRLHCNDTIAPCGRCSRISARSQGAKGG